MGKKIEQQLLSIVATDTDSRKPTILALMFRNEGGDFESLPVTFTEGDHVAIWYRELIEFNGRRITGFSGVMKLPEGLGYPLFTQGEIHYEGGSVEPSPGDIKAWFQFGDRISINGGEEVTLAIPTDRF